MGNSQNPKTKNKTQANPRPQPHLQPPDRRQRRNQQYQTRSYIRPRITEPNTLPIQTGPWDLWFPKFANGVAEEEVGEEGPDAVCDYEGDG